MDLHDEMDADRRPMGDDAIMNEDEGAAAAQYMGEEEVAVG